MIRSIIFSCFQAPCPTTFDLSSVKITVYPGNFPAVLLDANGNTTELVNNDGGLLAHYEYSAYGEITAMSGTEAENNCWRYSTKYWDLETGLGFWGYRYGKHGRWLSRDPLGERGWNVLYVFVENDPFDKTDPIGLLCYNLAEKTVAKFTINSVTHYDVWAFLAVQSYEERGIAIPAPGGGGVIFKTSYTAVCRCQIQERKLTRTVECRKLKKTTRCEYSGLCGTVSMTTDEFYWQGSPSDAIEKGKLVGQTRDINISGSGAPGHDAVGLICGNKCQALGAKDPEPLSSLAATVSCEEEGARRGL